MKWFKHFTDAHDSKDLTKVRMRYGADGYAIYWYCLELIAGDLGTNGINFELKHDAEVIAFNLKIDQLRVEEIMGYMVELALFEQSTDTITCLKLAKYLDRKLTRNSTIHDIIDKHVSLIKPSRTFRDSKPTLRGKSGQSPLDTDTDTDTEIKNTTSNKQAYFDEVLQSAISSYHDHLPKLPLVTRVGKTRRQSFAARFNEGVKYQSVEFWDWYFSGVAEIDFYRGDSKNGWRPDFTWLVKPKNFDSMLDRIDALAEVSE